MNNMEILINDVSAVSILKSEMSLRLLDSFYDVFHKEEDPLTHEIIYYCRCQLDPHYVLLTNAKVPDTFKIDKYVKNIATVEKYYYTKLDDTEKSKIPFVIKFD